MSIHSISDAYSIYGNDGLTEKGQNARKNGIAFLAGGSALIVIVLAIIALIAIYFSPIMHGLGNWFSSLDQLPRALLFLFGPPLAVGLIFGIIGSGPAMIVDARAILKRTLNDFERSELLSQKSLNVQSMPVSHSYPHYQEL